MMDLFSLEDEDYQGMFITQSSSNESNTSVNSGIISDSSDFLSPCVSLISQNTTPAPVYPDISDEDDFVIPSSQVQESANRYVHLCHTCQLT